MEEVVEQIKLQSEVGEEEQTNLRIVVEEAEVIKLQIVEEEEKMSPFFQKKWKKIPVLVFFTGRNVDGLTAM